jgi:hypothetical protein
MFQLPYAFDQKKAERHWPGVVKYSGELFERYHGNMDSVAEYAKSLKRRAKKCMVGALASGALWFYTSASIIGPKIATIEDPNTRMLYGALSAALVIPTLAFIGIGHSSDIKAINLESAVRVYQDIKL